MTILGCFGGIPIFGNPPYTLPETNSQHFRKSWEKIRIPVRQSAYDSGANYYVLGMVNPSSWWFQSISKTLQYIVVNLDRFPK